MAAPEALARVEPEAPTTSVPEMLPRTDEQPTTTEAAIISLEGYVGLPLVSATARAEAEGRDWQVSRVDGEAPEVDVPIDGTIVFEVDDDRVTRATIAQA